MKKRLAAILAATMVLGTVPCAFAADQITVTVDGEKVNFEDQQPVNIDGRIMVPIRDVAEKMGWEVEWYGCRWHIPNRTFSYLYKADCIY